MEEDPENHQVLVHCEGQTVPFNNVRFLLMVEAVSDPYVCVMRCKCDGDIFAVRTLENSGARTHSFHSWILLWELAEKIAAAE
jgi:hypothetical protein